MDASMFLKTEQPGKRIHLGEKEMPSICGQGASQRVKVKLRVWFHTRGRCARRMKTYSQFPMRPAICDGRGAIESMTTVEEEDQAVLGRAQDRRRAVLCHAQD